MPTNYDKLDEAEELKKLRVEVKYVACLDWAYTRIEEAQRGGVDFTTAKREAYLYLKAKQQEIYDASMWLARTWPCETCGHVTQLSNTQFHRYCGKHMVGEPI